MHKVNSIYAITKFSAENLLKNITTDIQRIVLRFGIIYSERHEGNLSALERLFLDVKQNDIVTVGSKKNARKFIHIDDIISGIISACRSKEVFKYEIFNLSGEDLITLDQIIKDSAVLFKKDINIVENSPNKTTSRNVDNSKARQKLNWNPKISFKDGLNNLFNRLK
jgi:nucleoside-diphosphate-sugar epimerase